MNRYIILLFIIYFIAHKAAAQQIIELTLQETIKLAQQNSPDAQTAQHSLRSEYWNYKYYKANYLPALTLVSNPYFTRSINKVTLSDGSVKFVEQNMVNSDLSLVLTQNIPFTGGSIFVESMIERVDMLNQKTTSWQTSPVNIGYRQSIFGYNSLKWDKRIEPIRYTEAQKTYLETMELVAVYATDRFFALFTAQSNLETALLNYANADTLYQYAQGRYSIGTITENEMLQLELNRLTEETKQLNAKIEVENSIQNLRSYLGIQENCELKAIVKEEMLQLTVDLEKAVSLANSNSPDIQNMLRRRLESESSVAQAKANTGLKAEIYMRFGLNQTADKLGNAYKSPLNEQYINLSLSLPILDWGRGKGRVRVARSRRDLVFTQTEQEKTNFDLNVHKLVSQFNLQSRRVSIAARTDETAQKRYEVARRLYILGKSSILDLNASIAEKDSARRNYISAVYNYWILYYTLRSLTLYDFKEKKELTLDIEQLIK